MVLEPFTGMMKSQTEKTTKTIRRNTQPDRILDMMSSEEMLESFNTQSAHSIIDKLGDQGCN